MKHLWKEKKKKRCEWGGMLYNNLNQKTKLRGPAPPLIIHCDCLGFDLCTSCFWLWVCIAEEAPGSNFSCFIKGIMTQMFAQVCSQSQKYPCDSRIRAMCLWGALIDRTMPIGCLSETSFNNSLSCDYMPWKALNTSAFSKGSPKVPKTRFICMTLEGIFVINLLQAVTHLQTRTHTHYRRFHQFKGESAMRNKGGV